MDPYWISGGAVTAGLAWILGGRRLRRRRVDTERDARRREAAAQEAALQDAARAVARVESSLARREDAFRASEADLRERTKTILDRERSIETTRERLRGHEHEIERRLAVLQDLERKVERAQDEVQERLAEVAGLEPAEALAELLEALDKDFAAERERRVAAAVHAARDEAEARARDVVLTALGRYRAAPPVPAMACRVPIPSADLTGRVIGREGRNVRALEAASGCDIVVDEAAKEVVVSSFDGARREVARRALVRLLDDGRIQPERIEEVVREEAVRVEARAGEAGREAAGDARVEGLHPEVVQLLGRLRFRTSYAQNVLAHAVEVAHLSGLMAAELGLDAARARRIGLLHDLGKALDQTVEGKHDAAAARVLRRHGEAPEVVEAVAAHHDPGDLLDPYVALVQVADAISAARPGARRENVSHYVERMTQLERLAAAFPGVARAVAIRAGREVRVLLDAEARTDEGATHLAWEIARKIEKDLAWTGEVRVTVIREFRATDTAG